MWPDQEQGLYQAGSRPRVPFSRLDLTEAKAVRERPDADESSRCAVVVRVNQPQVHAVLLTAARLQKNDRQFPLFVIIRRRAQRTPDGDRLTDFYARTRSR